MKKQELTVIQIVLPQVVAYLVGALGFIGTILVYAWIVHPCLVFFHIDPSKSLSSEHQLYLVVFLLFFACAIGIAGALICGYYVHKKLSITDTNNADQNADR